MVTERLILSAAVGDFLRSLLYCSSRPVKMLSVIFLRIHIQIFLRHIEGFMGIKGLQMEKQVSYPDYDFFHKDFGGFGETMGLWENFFFPDTFWFTQSYLQSPEVPVPCCF